MIDDSNDANGLGPAAPRILARQLARPLTANEIDHIAGGMISHAATGSLTIVPRADTCTQSGCPANDSDA